MKNGTTILRLAHFALIFINNKTWDENNVYMLVISSLAGKLVGACAVGSQHIQHTWLKIAR